MDYNITLGQAVDNQKNKFDVLNDVVSILTSNTFIGGLSFNTDDKIYFIVDGAGTALGNRYLCSYLLDTLEPNILSNRSLVDMSASMLFEDLFDFFLNMPVGIKFINWGVIENFINANSSDVSSYQYFLTHSNELNSEIIEYSIESEGVETVFSIEFFNDTNVVIFSRKP